MTRSARNDLVVFLGGEERPGVIVYGLVVGSKQKSSDFPSRIWPNSDQVKHFRLQGDAWEIFGWDVVVSEWPAAERWAETVKATLKLVVDAGAVIAWLGAEGLPFSDPPGLFSPEWMSGGVLAAMTSAGEFECAVDLDSRVEALSDDWLLRLRRHLHELVGDLA